MSGAATRAGAARGTSTIETLRAPLGMVERAMDEFLARAPMAPQLREAVRYSALGGGKRLRPLLAMHSAAAVGGTHEDGLASAVAVELIHAFSLVHDDLPSMDDDDLRRGRLTTHKKFGEAMGVLAGDALLALAFGSVVEMVDDPALAGRLTAELACGTSGMITGQVYDTLGGFDSRLSDLERLRLIHASKTGALIRAACRMGALGAMGPSPDESRLRAVTGYAESVGLMFQVVDDLLDVEQSTEKLGKRAGKDEAAGKMTFPGVLGVERSREEVERLLAEALGSVAPLGEGAEALRSLAEFMAVRTS